MTAVEEPRARPLLRGARGAIAAAHPLAVSAGIRVLADGGTAADAAVAAQAVLCVLMPQACGLGGDGLFLVAAGEELTAVNGVGVAGEHAPDPDRPGSVVTVPGIVSGWEQLTARWGRSGLAHVLRPAIELARDGSPVGADLRAAAAAQAERLAAGGADGWPLSAVRGDAFVQPRLAALLQAIADQGAAAFYSGAIAAAIAAAVVRHGGRLGTDRLAAHAAEVTAPLQVAWDGGQVAVQPPPSQGVLLAAALQWAERHGLDGDAEARDHAAVEVTEAVFAHRAHAFDPAAVLAAPLDVDRRRAARRGGPRAYLHTAGVAVADADGLVVSSLCSVFDDFGSAVFVPEGGFTLNNRARGFTRAPNDYAPGKRPVHTLAPALLSSGDDRLALATPGADGQVQTLLQVLVNMRWGGADLGTALALPRWRSEHGRLLVERSFARTAALAARGHDTVECDDGDDRFGAAVAAGTAGGWPYAAADWRREVWAGAV